MSNYTCRLCGGIDDNASVRQVAIWYNDTDTICGECWEHTSKVVPFSLRQLNDAIDRIETAGGTGADLRSLWLRACVHLQG